MTLDALQGPVERPRDEHFETFAIGEPDSNIFLCPRCARPLATGVSRCGGCGTRLVAGVRLVKAAGFAGIGLAAGLLLGGGSVGAILITDRSVAAAPAQATVPGQVPTPAGSAAPGASGVPAPVPVIAPASAASALQQATVLNQRLLADAMVLERVLKRKSPSAEDIAPILRSLASSAGFGDRVAPTLRSWDAGAAVAKGLATFYAAVARVADEGLSASLANDRAYADAGRRMRSVLDRITDLDAAARGLAASAGIELPPLVPAK